MTEIVAFAGKKQSGKNTACNGLMMLQLLQHRICQQAKMDDDGTILVSDILGDRIPEQEWIRFEYPTIDINRLMQDLGNPVKIYALADPLKELCINILGLPREKVYGTDEDKNELSGLKWEDMPSVVSERSKRTANMENGDTITLARKKFIFHRPGEMTIREVLQYVGTDVFRSMYSHVWIDTLVRRIKSDAPELALICDARFDNEILRLKELGAIVIGLTRNSHLKDKHASERVNLDLCHSVIDNRNLSITQQVHAVYDEVVKHGCQTVLTRKQ